MKTAAFIRFFTLLILIGSGWGANAQYFNDSIMIPTVGNKTLNSSKNNDLNPGTTVVPLNSSTNLFTEITTNLTGVHGGDVQWGDYDNDGDLDVLVSGYTDPDEGSRIYGSVKIYRNEGNDVFSDFNATFSIPGYISGHASWTDIDKDNDLDVAIIYRETSNIFSTHHTKIYKNVGTNAFTDIGVTLTGGCNATLAWGDYNNDGYIDLYMQGDQSYAAYFAIIYKNNGNYTFTDINAGLFREMCVNSAAWGDFDHDGYLDLFYGGFGGATSATKLYHNINGTNTFASIPWTNPGAGPSTWIDFDNDNYPDLISGSWNGDSVRIYKNNGNETFSPTTFVFIAKPVSSNGCVIADDYNSDGYQDVFITGGISGYRSDLYKNNAATSFTHISNTGIIPLTSSDASFGDYNGDGFLELLIEGWDGTKNVTKIYKKTPTSDIQATNITFSNITNNQFTFNWTDGNGAKRAVFIKQDSLGTASPVNNTTYAANTAFGSGSQIGTTGWYCVFNGTTHSSGVTVTNLSPGITYRVMVCEYNGNAGAEQYNTSTAYKNPQNQKTIICITTQIISTLPFVGINSITAYKTINNKIYLFGAQVPPYSGIWTAVDKIRIYDLTTNSWDLLPMNLPYPVFDFGTKASYFSNHFYFGPGFSTGNSNGFGSHKKMVDVNLNNSNASENQSFSGSNIWNISSIEAYSKIYFLGGYSGVYQVNKIWEYNPATETLVQVATFNNIRTSVSGILGTDGWIYCIGGFTNIIERFNPVTYQVQTMTAVTSGVIYAALNFWHIASQHAIYFFAAEQIDPIIYKYDYVADLVSNTGLTLAGTFAKTPSVIDINDEYSIYAFKLDPDFNNPLKLCKLTLGCENEPSIQATNLTFSNITNNQFNFNWTDGNGNSRVAFIKEGSDGSAFPVNSTTYTPNTAFGIGSQIGTTGWYCVFNGTTHPDGITVTNLSSCKTYRIMVCEYTGPPGSEIYNISTAFKNPENVQTSGSIVIPTDGLVAWYPFNGNANDESGNGHNGTVNGATLATDRFGNPNTAYYFNGNSKIMIPDDAKLNFPSGGYSISVWAKRTSNQQFGHILGKRNGGGNFQYQIAYADAPWSDLGISFGGRSYTLGLLNSYVATEYVCPLNIWLNIIGTFDGNVYRVFINGSLIDSLIAVSIPSEAVPLTIGASGSYSSQSFSYSSQSFIGPIDDIRIYNRALTSTEIQVIYHEGEQQPIVVTSPNGGERWKVGDIHPITWTSCGVDNVKIEYSINKGANWTTITSSTQASSGAYSWTVPNTPSDLCLVKITSASDAAVFDVSDTTFQIYIEHQGSIINNDTTLCAGDTLQLNSRPALTYRWYPSNGLSNDTIQNPILVVDSSRTYYLETTDIADNLVDNGDFEQGNTGFISTYTNCNTQNCLGPLGDNGYAVGKDANYYHNLFTGVDHTTGSGNFMIVNGARPELIVWKKNISIKPNSNYAFGAWISTMIIGGVYPAAQIRFSINSIQLGPIYIAPDAINQWDQVFTTWNSGNNTSATIEIVDVLPVYNGNDFGLDDIFFGEITTNLDSIRITVGNAKIDLGPDTYLCKGSTMTLDAGPGFNSYSWNTGAKTQTIVVAGAGKYSVSATRGNCTATGEISIGQNPLPIVDLGPDKEKFIGQKLLLQSSTGPFSHYFWSTGDTSSSISVTNSGKYWLKATDPWGCVGYDTVEVTNLGAEIRIPNAFTPNGDGYNDYFGPVTEGIETLEMKINDRYGRQVNIIDTVNGLWDGNMPSGSKAPQGVYFYLLKAMGYDQMEYVHQGIVNLYRDLIDLMPNPVKDKAVLDMSGRFTGEKIISIYNSSGSLVKTWTTMDDVHQFDLSFLRPGFYILRATNSEQVNVIKFIKE